MKRAIAIALLLLIAASLPTSRSSVAAGDTPPPVDRFAVVNRWPHDPEAYTEGLVYNHGTFYESTGLDGKSSVRKVDAETGQVLARVALPAEYFGEGLTLFGGTLYQLTWHSHVALTYDPQCLCPERTFTYDGEGWGLTHDEDFLIMSDGTERLRFLDPRTFTVVRTISVFDHGKPLTNLNELEYINGEIYANVWLTDRIARIDPASGEIVGWIDLTGLLPAADRGPSVNELNGIAYDATSDRLIVTGKNWPEIFQVTLVPA